MIQCPNCQHTSLVGTLFCGDCGIQLVFGQMPAGPAASPAAPEADQPAEPLALNVELKIVENGKILPLTGSEQITLGRSSREQPILPDIDLTPFNAYESGVSRLHATIHIRDQQIIISDLGSANGTRLNGTRLPAYSPQRLSDGDILTLGRLKIQVHLHP